LDLKNDLIWVSAKRIEAKQFLKTGDIAICMSSGSRKAVGKTALCRQDAEGSVGAFCGIIRPRELVEGKFLFYWLRSPNYLAWRSLQSRGTNIQNIRFSQLSKMKVPLPPKGEQKRIAAILNERMAAIDKARAAAEAQLDAAHAINRAFFRESFGTTLPLSVNRSGDRDRRGWKWRLLRDIARLESGHTPSRYHPEWWGGDIPWLALPDIRSLDGRYALQTTEYTNNEGLANSSARLLPEGTVCLSRTASVGFVTVLGRPMATSQDFVNWVCGRDLDPEFLMHLFLYSRDYFVSLASGAIHKTVYMPTVERLSVLLPLISEQKRITALLKERMAGSERIKISIEKRLVEINALPQALLRQAFNGAL